MPLCKPNRRHFTEAARVAAIEARRRKREETLPREAPDVFVVRLPGAALQFGWEIRRFGAIVLDRSHAEFSTSKAAYAAGRKALTAQDIRP